MPRVIGMSYNQFLVRPGHKNEIAISMLDQSEMDFRFLDKDTRNQRLHEYADYMKLNIGDVEKQKENQRLCTIKDINNIIDFVKKHSDKNVIVHCNAGISRTGAIVYLLHKLGYQNNQEWVVKNDYIKSEKYLPNRYMISLIESVVE